MVAINDGAVRPNLERSLLSRSKRLDQFIGATLSVVIEFRTDQGAVGVKRFQAGLRSSQVTGHFGAPAQLSGFYSRALSADLRVN